MLASLDGRRIDRSPVHDCSMIERVSGLPSASLYERRNLFDLYDESDRVSRSLYNDTDECAMRNEPARRCVDAWRIVVRKARYCAGRKMFAVSRRLGACRGCDAVESFRRISFVLLRVVFSFGEGDLLGHERSIF